MLKRTENRQYDETFETSNGSPTLDSLTLYPNADATYSTVTTFYIVGMNGCSLLYLQAMEPSSDGHRNYANPSCRCHEDPKSES
ncbi:hypothetical protein B9Z55_015626 [Caenorhabditis nigoni]|uniref:Uncharacterized protein n=1 Tax=Caenorhabditis nigoni TaxID=1611254 RepID=A0A2G5UB26_9PELO|nr:hypothetical protein B9Z55_015626 [Caenorhabditis nigoni]